MGGIDLLSGKLYVCLRTKVNSVYLSTVNYRNLRSYGRSDGDTGTDSREDDRGTAGVCVAIDAHREPPFPVSCTHCEGCQPSCQEDSYMSFTGLEASAEDVRTAELAGKKPSLMRTKQDGLDLPVNLSGEIPKMAPQDSEAAARYLRLQHTTESDDWFRKCLVLQRTARGIPALAPSAIAAAALTPESERVYLIDDLRRGMVGYCDDPYDSNASGHIFYILGRDKENRILTWSNDVKGTGKVDVVYLDFYKARWGDTFQFGATWLNGYDFSDFNKPAEPVKHFSSLGDRYLSAIDDLKKIRVDKEKRNNKQLVRVLTRDIDRMEKHYEKYAA